MAEQEKGQAVNPAATHGWERSFDEVLAHGVLLIVLDESRRCRYVSPGLAALTGYEQEELVGMPAEVLIHEQDQKRFDAAATAQVLSTDPLRPIRCRLVTLDGQVRTVDASIGALPADNPMGSVVITATDRTEQLEQQGLQSESQRIVHMVAEGRPLAELLSAIVAFLERRAPGCRGAIMGLDESGNHLRVLAAPSLPDALLDQLDGVPLSPAAGSCAVAARLRSPVMVSKIERDPRWIELRDVALSSGVRACWSTPLISRGAGPLLGTIALYWDDPGAPTSAQNALMDNAAGLATVALDRARLEGELVHQITHDDLTGLPERSLLRERCDQALARLRRGQLGQVALVLIDIDGFRDLNQQFGFATCDQLLGQIADRIRTTVREVDTVARFGGDEFAVLAHTEDPTALARRIDVALVMPFPAVDVLSLACSVAVAIADADDTTETLLKRADAAMRATKSAKRAATVASSPGPT